MTAPPERQRLAVALPRPVLTARRAVLAWPDVSRAAAEGARDWQAEQLEKVKAMQKESEQLIQQARLTGPAQATDQDGTLKVRNLLQNAAALRTRSKQVYDQSSKATSRFLQALDKRSANIQYLGRVLEASIKDTYKLEPQKVVAEDLNFANLDASQESKDIEKSARGYDDASWPAPGSRDFAQGLARALPQFRLRPVLPGAPSACKRDRKGPLPLTAAQRLLAELMRPLRPRGIGRILVRHGAGTGKTALTYEALLKWILAARAGLLPSPLQRMALILVPNDKSFTTWPKEFEPFLSQFGSGDSKRQEATWVRIDSNKEPSTLEMVIDRGRSSEFHIFIQKITVRLPDRVLALFGARDSENDQKGIPYVLPSSYAHPAYASLSESHRALLEKTVAEQKLVRTQVAVPAGGFVTVDEAHNMIDASEIAASAPRANTVLAWANAIRASLDTRAMALTATPAIRQDRPCDLIRLCNVLRPAAAEQVFEGVWRRTLLKTEKDTPLDHAYKAASDAETNYLRAVLFEATPTGSLKWIDGKKDMFELAYVGLVSDFQLERDLRVFPRLMTPTCPSSGLGKIDVNEGEAPEEQDWGDASIGLQQSLQPPQPLPPQLPQPLQPQLQPQALQQQQQQQQQQPPLLRPPIPLETMDAITPNLGTVDENDLPTKTMDPSEGPLSSSYDPLLRMGGLTPQPPRKVSPRKVSPRKAKNQDSIPAQQARTDATRSQPADKENKTFCHLRYNPTTNKLEDAPEDAGVAPGLPGINVFVPLTSEASQVVRSAMNKDVKFWPRSRRRDGPCGMVTDDVGDISKRLACLNYGDVENMTSAVQKGLGMKAYKGKVPNKLKAIRLVMSRYMRDKHFMFSSAKDFDTLGKAAVPFFKSNAGGAMTLVSMTELAREMKASKLFVSEERKGRDGKGNRLGRKEVEDELEKEGEDESSLKSEEDMSDADKNVMRRFVDQWYRSERNPIKERFVFYGYSEPKDRVLKELSRLGISVLRVTSVMMELYNDPRNDQGQYIRLFIGDRSAKEQLSLLMTSVVHLDEPSPNMTMQTQSIARATRQCSFQRQDDVRLWRVRVYRYVNTFATSSGRAGRGRGAQSSSSGQTNMLTADEYQLRALAESLAYPGAYELLLTALRESALDCPLFRTYIGDLSSCFGDAPVPIPSSATATTPSGGIAGTGSTDAFCSAGGGRLFMRIGTRSFEWNKDQGLVPLNIPASELRQFAPASLSTADALRLYLESTLQECSSRGGNLVRLSALTVTDALLLVLLSRLRAEETNNNTQQSAAITAAARTQSFVKAVGLLQQAPKAVPAIVREIRALVKPVRTELESLIWQRFQAIPPDAARAILRAAYERLFNVDTFGKLNRVIQAIRRYTTNVPNILQFIRQPPPGQQGQQGQQGQKQQQPQPQQQQQQRQPLTVQLTGGSTTMTMIPSFQRRHPARVLGSCGFSPWKSGALSTPPLNKLTITLRRDFRPLYV